MMLSMPVWTCAVGLLIMMGPSQQQSCNKMVSNNMVDFVLAQLVTTVYHSIELAPINQTFFHGHGWLILDNGTAQGLDTLRRVGDLEIDANDEYMQVNLTISFSNFTIAFDKLKVKLFLLKTTGSFSTSIIENEVKITATMRHKSLCFVEINSIEFKKLDDFRIGLHFSCGKCSSTVNWMTKHAMDALNGVVRGIVQEKVDTFIRSVLKNNEESMVCQSIKE